MMSRSSWMNSLLSVIFPRLCASCEGRLNVGEDFFCFSCMVELPRTNYYDHLGNEMEQRFWGKIDIERATALFHFEKHEGFRHAIHQLKYKNNPKLAYYLGHLSAKEAAKSSFFEGIDALVPVPLHWLRKWKRGYNQSEMIARGIEQETGIKVHTNWVKRIRNNQSQTQQKSMSRYANVDSIFKVIADDELKGKHLLLIDDVCTSGSTLEVLAAELQKTANVKISILTLAVTRFHLPKLSLF